MDGSSHEEIQNEDVRITGVPCELAETQSEARFIGRPILALNPATNNTSLPDRFRDHDLIRGQFFYTLPSRIVEAIRRATSQNAIDDDLLEMETELSRISGDHDSRVGFWMDLHVGYNVLRQSPMPTPTVEVAQAQGWNLNQAEIDFRFRILNERLEKFAVVSRGYAGWLMTNPQFLDEHDALMTEFGEQVRRWGTHLVGLPHLDRQRAGLLNPTGEAGWGDFEMAITEFLVRWRLRSLAGPGLPVPMEPLMSGDFPVTLLQQLMRAGGVFNWPDTFPILSRNELRGILEDALRGERRADHLADWMAIVHGSNPAKNKIRRYGRLFALQHFWRQVHLRHLAAMEGSIQHFEIEFAYHLGVSQESIHADLITIRRRIGNDWTHRAAAPVRPTRPR